MDGSKNKIGYCNANYFSINGLLLKSETYRTDNQNEKSVVLYYYTNNRLDSTSSPSKKEYIYERQGRLKNVVSNGFNEDNKNEIEEEHFFYDSKNLICKSIKKLDSIETNYKYNKNGEIIFIKTIDLKTGQVSQIEHLLDDFDNCLATITKDKLNKVIDKTEYSRVKDNMGNPTLIQWVNINSNTKFKVFGKQTYSYDSNENSVNIIYYNDDKPTNVYESKIVYYNAEELIQKSTDHNADKN